MSLDLLDLALRPHGAPQRPRQVYLGECHDRDRRRRDRQRGRRRQPRRPPRRRLSSLPSIIHPENLLQVYRRLLATGGRAAGIDGIRMTDLSISEMAAALRHVSQAIRDQRYLPYPARAVRIAKANGGHRELRIRVVCDRVVAAALQQALARRLDEQLLPGCIGFRPGRSVLDYFARMEQIIAAEQRYVIATDDIRDAFGSVRIADALEAIRVIIPNNRIMQLLEVVLRGHEGPARTVGIDQGLALSPNVLNQLLHACLDRPFTDGYSAETDNPPWLRWADDLAYLCHCVSEGQRAIESARELLAVAGFQLKGTAGHPVDLRREGAGVYLLGLRVGWGDNGMTLQIPERAWAKLGLGLEQAHEGWNPTGMAQTMIHGWMDMYGMALGGAERCEIDRLLTMAARAGFHECGPRSKLEAIVRGSQARWADKRSLYVPNSSNPIARAPRGHRRVLD